VLQRHLPTAGIALAVGLFVGAAIRYPGGSTDSAATVGYSWTHNFISSLFAPRALNGAANPARFIAIAAMFVMCLSLGAVFLRLSRQVGSRAHRKTIEIGGIGAMIYSFLVVTPTHDLMVTFGLVFGLAALIATTHLLYVERRWSLFFGGSLSIALTLSAATMYYGNVFSGLLPLMQKVSLTAGVGWLLFVHYARRSPEREGADDRSKER
jgi:hypothetical protein